jgi:hypothetical protein
MSTRSWMQNEWKDIKGNVKYEVYKWGAITLGGLMVATFGLLVHKVVRYPEWAPYAAVFVLALFGFAWFSDRLRAVAQKTAPQFPKQVDAETETPVLDPKPPNLKAEILEALFSMKRQSLSNNIFILMQLRVVNHGEEEVVVTDWRLTVAVNREAMDADEHQIPNNWQIRRFPKFGPPTMENINADASAFVHPLKKGVPKTRWVCFRLINISRILPPHNARFILTLVDAFGKSHISEFGPGFASDVGEIVEV